MTNEEIDPTDYNRTIKNEPEAAQLDPRILNIMREVVNHMSDQVNSQVDEMPPLEEVPQIIYETDPEPDIKPSLQDLLTQPEPEEYIQEFNDFKEELKEEISEIINPLESSIPEIFSEGEFDDTKFVSEYIPEFRSDQNRLDLDVGARTTHMLVPTELELESEDPADILVDPNVTTIIPLIEEKPYEDMVPLADFLSPVAMAITPDNSEDEEDYKVWTTAEILAPPIPAEIDEQKFQVTDDGDVILTEPDNMQFEHKPLDILSEGVVALPPEENMELVRTKNLIRKRKQPNNAFANIKKIKNETDVTVRDVVLIKKEEKLAIVKHPIQRKMENNIKQDKKIASIEANKEKSLVKIKPEGGQLRPTVDAATMRLLPWIDFDSIIDNTESSRRQQVIFDLLQNNLPDSADDIYYIYHDEKTKTFSIEVDESSKEIQNFIGSIMLIDARLEVEDLSDKERQTLIRKQKMKIKELEKTYGTKVAANLLEKRMTLDEKKEIEEEIVRMQAELNKDKDEYYHIFNEETGEFEVKLDQDIDLMHQIVGAIIKIDEKYELERSENNKRINRRIKRKFIAKLNKLGVKDLADSDKKN